MLVNGVWQQKWQPVQDQDNQGRFIRQTSSFRNWITRDGAAGITGQDGYPAQAGRYHLYVAYICPWASRTLMARALKGLQEIISVSVVSPKLTDQGWKFAGLGSNGQDELSHKTYLHELYSQVVPDFTGRATVPVLWDKQTHTIVNNESADIVRMLNSAFVELVDQGPDLVPAGLMAEIDALNDYLYTHLNNGVYQAGFATSQAAYEEAYEKVFTALDTLEQRLSDGRSFLFGDALTESDLRLFVTLIRFDLAYYGLFKCNRNMIKDMPVLYRYMQRVLRLKGIAETVNVDHIKQGYYSIKALNPNGIVPKWPVAIFQ